MTANNVLSQLMLSLVLSLSVTPAESKAEDRRFEAQLIWGTDMEIPNDPKLKKVDPELVERFHKVLRKWRYYYQVEKKEFVVPAKKTTTVKLSEKCELEVTDKGKPMTEIKLFGEKKLVKKVTQAVTQCLVIVGDDPNETFWYVVLTPK